MIVYLITNLINNKKYVGYTQKTLDERIKAHLYKSRAKSNKHYFYLLPIAIRKYGIENFKWEILFETDNKMEVLNKEIYYIKKLNSLTPNGYNLTEGGNGGIQSNETKVKISNSLKKYYEINGWTNNVDKKVRSKAAKKAWITKKNNNYSYPKGFTRSSESKLKMSETKNEINKVKWFNLITLESIELSPTKMAKYCNLSVGVFNHLKNGRQKQTKCGWTYLGN